VPLSLSSKSLLPANWVDSKVVQGLFAFAKSKHSVQINEEPKSIGESNSFLASALFFLQGFQHIHQITEVFVARANFLTAAQGNAGYVYIIKQKSGILGSDPETQ
jgi:hypothetical protein